MTQDAPIPVDLFTLLRRDSVFWPRPIGMSTSTDGAPFASTARRFNRVELLTRRMDGVIAATATLDQLDPAAFHKVRDVLSPPRPAWAGLSLDRTLLMGIVNATPDSFSDGGAFLDPAHAIAHGQTLLAAGADIIDIGGESTRPNAAPVPPDEELRRVEPVIRELANAGALISIDTRHAKVMGGALDAGARIINDISALSDDPASLALAARRRAPVVLMHKQGDPANMQRDPHYDFAPLDILEYLDSRIEACRAAGIAPADIVIDPGIGFGKTKDHNRQILERIALFHALGTGVLVGLSRKSFLGGAVNERVAASVAAGIAAAKEGVQILRVHDVAETRAALDRL